MVQRTTAGPCCWWWWCLGGRRSVTVAMIVAMIVGLAVGPCGLEGAAAFGDRPAVGKERTRRLQNVSQTIEELLKGYDIRLRPQFGGDPLYIEMELDLASFDSISEVNMDYTITIHLNQYWKDERLAFSHHYADNMTLTGDFAELIWVPDTFFANDKHSFLHDVTEINKMVRLHGDGSIVYGMRFTTTLACMMDLHNYPLDEQNCTVEIESYGYPTQDVIMKWRGSKKTDAVHGVERAEIPQFTVVDYRTTTTLESLATGSYGRLSLSFKLERNIGYFIFQTYLPSIFIVMLSWVSFWINYEATSARVTLGITTVLTMTTISTGVRSSLPRISYVKAIDIYLVMCFVFVFAALLEYAAVNYTYWGARAKRKAKRLRLQQQSKRQQQRDDGYQSNLGRMSPIPSIRNRSSGYASRCPDDYTYLGGDVSSNAHHRSKVLSHPSYNVRVTHRAGQAPARRVAPSSQQQQRQASRRKQVLTALKDRAKDITRRIPSVTDVSKIDKYSRLLFPSLFVVFNACYWSFYLLQ